MPGRHDDDIKARALSTGPPIIRSAQIASGQALHLLDTPHQSIPACLTLNPPEYHLDHSQFDLAQRNQHRKRTPVPVFPAHIWKLSTLNITLKEGCGMILFSCPDYLGIFNPLSTLLPRGASLHNYQIEGLNLAMATM